MDAIKQAFSGAAFTPKSLISPRGILHILEIVFGMVAFAVSLQAPATGSYWVYTHSYWTYCRFTWFFCPFVTLVITMIELFKLDVLLNMFCMDWPDFTTGMAMTSTLMTLSVAIMCAVMYVCATCIYAWVATIFAFLLAVAYFVEVLWDKICDKKKGSYLAVLPGFWKVMEAFVSCVIFISLPLTAYYHHGWLIVCVIAYILPFPFILLIIVVNLLKMLKKMLPFNLDRVVFILLIVFVVLYVFAAIVWSVYTFRGRPVSFHCRRGYYWDDTHWDDHIVVCIYHFRLVVAVFTYINLILFVVDLVFTLMGICGFKRG